MVDGMMNDDADAIAEKEEEEAAWSIMRSSFFSLSRGPPGPSCRQVVVLTIAACNTGRAERETEKAVLGICLFGRVLSK